MYANGKRRRPTTCSSIQGRHTSAVACAHRQGDIGRGLPASLKRHRSWYARLRKETLAKGRQHKPRHARISRGGCVSDGGHYSQPTAGGISQLTSFVAYAHWPGDIGQWQAALVKACTHRPWCEHIGWVTPASDNGRQYQPRPARIGRGLCPSGKRRRPKACIISQGLHASVVACAHRQGDIGRGLRASDS